MDKLFTLWAHSELCNHSDLSSNTIFNDLPADNAYKFVKAKIGNHLTWKGISYPIIRFIHSLISISGKKSRSTLPRHIK